VQRDQCVALTGIAANAAAKTIEAASALRTRKQILTVVGYLQRNTPADLLQPA
jgi:hypothetical protein